MTRRFHEAQCIERQPCYLRQPLSSCIASVADLCIVLINFLRAVSTLFCEGDNTHKATALPSTTRKKTDSSGRRSLANGGACPDHGKARPRNPQEPTGADPEPVSAAMRTRGEAKYGPQNCYGPTQTELPLAQLTKRRPQHRN